MTRRYGPLFMDASPPSSEGTKQPARPYRLLFVDDDPHILSALRRVFHRENYELRFAENAEAALAILEFEAVEVVISDFKMPGMDGNALLQRVRERWPQILRIMVTGYANSEVVLGSMRDGAVFRFNLKPWNDDDLRLTVAMALEQYEARQRRNGSKRTATPTEMPLPLEEIDVAERNALPRFLHDRGWLNARQLQRLHGQMQTSRLPAVQHLVRNEWVDQERLYALLRDEKLCEEIDLRESELDSALFSYLPLAACERHWMLPCRLENGRLDLAMADPLDTGLIDSLAAATGNRVRPLLCRIDQLQGKLKEATELHGANAADTPAQADEPPYDDIEIVLDVPGDTETLHEILSHSVDPPAVRLINGLLLEAINRGAREILIQPRLDTVAVRYRLDGTMQDILQVPTSLLMAVVSRFKVMTDLDVTERQAPQQGHITVKTSMRLVDMAISTLPTTHGEQIHIRLAPRHTPVLPLMELGLSGEDLERLQHAFAQPGSLIVAAGPADSGRSMLLHALLKSSRTTDHHVSLERSVQYANDTVAQVQLPHALPITTDMLEAAYAQQPEAVLIDDDHHDAETICNALRTTANASRLLTALTAMSIADVFSQLLGTPFDILEMSSSLGALVRQRLVRRLCIHCRRPAPPDPTLCQVLGGPFIETPKQAWEAVGCPRCRQGYQGRIGLYEVIVMDNALRNAIVSGRTPWELQSLIRKNLPTGLLGDAHAKVTQGLTTLAEVQRALGHGETPIE
ncbi:response regulator [Billgrantia pellis]|uniref:Response regulator n=1 Tax=Billgrantia pellis TaxID=2606936 RepID=A0A7V7KGM2_9GAMM|nr:ATPase, T2SS/T4P/T4SS family [Halomonas pellis]KAA0010012.1 response regulator [Halomonas pellis]